MDMNEDEDLLCDSIENILINHDEMKSYLKKLKESCNKFYAKCEHTILESISKSSECAKQLEKSSETLVELSNERRVLKMSLDNIKLEQKVVEKKAINTIKEIEDTKTEIESIKEKKDKLSLEIVDLQQEYEKSKEKMKVQWNALKRACKYYKDLLDIHIDVETTDHIEHVTVTFFRAENPTDKKFFVVLMNENNCWKVKKIEPELSMENKYQLNNVVRFSKLSEVTNVTALLCELRKLFIKNYFDS